MIPWATPNTNFTKAFCFLCSEVVPPAVYYEQAALHSQAPWLFMSPRGAASPQPHDDALTCRRIICNLVSRMKLPIHEREHAYVDEAVPLTHWSDVSVLCVLRWWGSPINTLIRCLSAALHWWGSPINTLVRCLRAVLRFCISAEDVLLFLVRGDAEESGNGLWRERVCFVFAEQKPRAVCEFSRIARSDG